MNNIFYCWLKASPSPVWGKTGDGGCSHYSYAFNNPLAFTDPSGYVNVGGGYNPLAAHWIDHGAYNDYLDQVYARGSYVYTGGQNLVHFTHGGAGPGSIVVSDGDFYSDNYSNDCYFSGSATAYQKQGSLIGSRGVLYPFEVKMFNIKSDKSEIKNYDFNNFNGTKTPIPGLKVHLVAYHTNPNASPGYNKSGGQLFEVEYTPPISLNDPWWSQRISTDDPWGCEVSPYWDGCCGRDWGISYYCEEEMKLYINGGRIYFHDFPQRPRDCYWDAVLTLWNGHTKILTIWWGFKITGGKIKPYKNDYIKW